MCRVALAKHTTPISRILTIALKLLKHEMLGIRLLVSYADLNWGHERKIYQASIGYLSERPDMNQASC
jgi:hypothetical protein